MEPSTQNLRTMRWTNFSSATIEIGPPLLGVVHVGMEFRAGTDLARAFLLCSRRKSPELGRAGRCRMQGPCRTGTDHQGASFGRRLPRAGRIFWATREDIVRDFCLLVGPAFGAQLLGSPLQLVPCSA